jgi:hypothetical protein
MNQADAAPRHALTSARAFQWLQTTSESSPAVRARQSHTGAALVASGIDGDDEEAKEPSPGRRMFQPRRPSAAIGYPCRPLGHDTKN